VVRTKRDAEVRKKLTPELALRLIIRRAVVPEFSTESHAQYNYVVTRDTLLLLGVEFPQAEHLANYYHGPAGARLKKCWKALRR